MLHYLYSDVALHSLHNFAMLHLKVFRALRIGARWGPWGAARMAARQWDGALRLAWFAYIVSKSNRYVAWSGSDGSCYDNRTPRDVSGRALAPIVRALG